MSSFAKKTGDIHVLSSVDLKLVALAYDVEKEWMNGSVAHLRTFPLASVNIENTSGRNVKIKMPGWDESPDAQANQEEWGTPEVEGEGEGTREKENKSKIVFHDLDETNMKDALEEEEEEEEEDKEAPSSSKHAPASAGEEEERSDDDNDDDDDGGWETARRSKNAQRKHKRKMLRRQERQDEEEKEEEHDQRGLGAGLGAGESSKDPVDRDANPSQSMQSTQQSVTVESSTKVVSLTGDFAMQNVLLQMGLKVAGPKDGMLIREARKFGLRCHACGYSTDKPEKLSNDIFCPKCGNMNTLERCQVVVGSDGRVSYLQIKKKQQSLRGTQYSLPQPQTGRNARNPILREDSLKLPKHKAKPNMDAFSPEYNDETWHTHTKNNTKSDLAKTIYLEEIKQLSKKNPNARKLTRTNRRR